LNPIERSFKGGLKENIVAKKPRFHIDLLGMLEYKNITQPSPQLCNFSIVAKTLKVGIGKEW